MAADLASQQRVVDASQRSHNSKLIQYVSKPSYTKPSYTKPYFLHQHLHNSIIYVYNVMQHLDYIYIYIFI